MKLDKTKILESESVLNSLLLTLVRLSTSMTDKRDLSANEILRLTQMARKSVESLLLLGLSLP